MKRVYIVFLVITLLLSYGIGTAEAPMKDPVKLTMYIPGADVANQETYQSIIDMVKLEQPHMDVEMVQIGWGEYFTKLNVAFSGGMAPDLFGVGLGQIGPVQGAGNMLALDSYLEDWDGFADMPENVLNIASRDGQLYGFPMLEMRILWRRTDLFEKAGIENPPQTIEEIYEYAQKLTEKDGNKINMSGVEIGTGEQSLFSTMLMFGADGLWGEDLKSLMLEPEALDAFEWCTKIMSEGLSDHTIMHDIQGSLFENGLAAMSFVGSSMLGTHSTKLGRENIAVSLLPGDKAMIGCTAWSVYSGTKYPEEAVALWKGFASREGQLAIAKGVGFVPTRASAKDEYLAMDPEFNAVFYEAANRAAPYGPLNPFFFDFVNNLRPLIDEVYYGQKEAKPAMEEFNATYDAVVESGGA